MGLDDFKKDKNESDKRQNSESDDSNDGGSASNVPDNNGSSDSVNIDERNTRSKQTDPSRSDNDSDDNSAAVHDNDASMGSSDTVSNDTDNSQDTDMDAVSTQSNNDSDPDRNDKAGDETESEDITGGLESFKSTSSRGGNKTQTQTDEEESPPFGIEPEKWNSMSKKEIVAEVRDRKIPDFRPNIQLDDRWTHKEVVELQCVCGNTFYFTTKGLCFECGRSYGKEGRTVVKINDPEGEIIHDSEPDQ